MSGCWSKITFWYNIFPIFSARNSFPFNLVTKAYRCPFERIEWKWNTKREALRKCHLIEEVAAVIWLSLGQFKSKVANIFPCINIGFLVTSPCREPYINARKKCIYKFATLLLNDNHITALYHRCQSTRCINESWKVKSRFLGVLYSLCPSRHSF